MHSLAAGLLAGALLAALCALPAAGAPNIPLPLEDAVKVPNQSVAPQKEVSIPLPALPARPGKAIVLRFRAIIVTPTPGGCNTNGSVRLNDAPLGRTKADGGDRLLGRPAGFELVGHNGLQLPAFSGTQMMVMFAPDADTGDAMTGDAQGATFVLDVSDVARGVDGNSLTFRSHLPEAPAGEPRPLQVTDIAVGWLDQSKLPKVPSAVPKRGAIAGGVTAGDLRLSQSARGGFALRGGDGPELLVETALGMKPDAAPALVADDGAAEVKDLNLTAEAWGPAGRRLTAAWAGLSLVRTLEIRAGLVLWKERWTNTGAEIRGVPLRHRLFLRDQDARFHVGGSPDNGALVCSAPNPTIFLGAAEDPGAGFGLTAESDWLRLLAGWRGIAGVGEVFTQWLALAPGSSIDFEMTLTPVANGGYWTFVNGLRRRWGVNGAAMERPYFWGFARDAGIADPEQRMAKALGHLGPIYVNVGTWHRLEPDARVTRAERYAKLPADAPRAPGKTPDLDVEAYLTFAHREPYWEQMRQESDRIHKAAPNAKTISIMHPSMECVYKPLQNRWPIAADAIKTAAGETFEDGSYDRSWVGAMTARDWGILYYCPRPGSAQLRALLDGMARALDREGLDGIYCDEFSWAWNQRGYSRYDYSRWDGYSADLDGDGKVLRLKADNGFVTESCQLQMAGEMVRRGRFFLGNGANALRSLNALPIHRFVEGGNGASWIPQGHLSPVPLVLGNFGDEKTVAGVFAAVKACLAQGAVYSPVAVNLLLEGDDNFVCKQYPITIEEVGPGWVVGRQRVVTTVTRSFAGPAEGGRVRLYRYDRQGTRIDAEADVTAPKGGPLSVVVPDGGMVIAERYP